MRMHVGFSPFSATLQKSVYSAWLGLGLGLALQKSVYSAWSKW